MKVIMARIRLFLLSGLLLLLPIIFPPAYCQSYFAFTTVANREQHDHHLREEGIRKKLRQPLSHRTEKEWQQAFWAMELVLYQTPETKNKLKEAWEQVAHRSESFQKALLEVSYTLYPAAFAQEATLLLQTTPSLAVFVRCAEYLLLSDKKKTRKQVHSALLQKRFLDTEFIGLKLLQKRLQQNGAAPRPPLKDLFSPSFLPGETIIYSLQRPNRDYPGLVLIRRPDGRLLRNGDGTVFHTPQLARAITNYPYYITNGNTPQGLYRWTGFDTSTNAYIGPTPNLQMVMPYEAEPAVFFNDSSRGHTVWQEEQYAALLPASWRDDDALYESFRAGAIGRSEIIMHGTTINPLYYKGQPYYPQTPSLGCLCSYEEWDPYGNRVLSHQQKIVDALMQNGYRNGYVLVIETGNEPKAVSLADLDQHGINADNW